MMPPLQQSLEFPLTPNSSLNVCDVFCRRFRRSLSVSKPNTLLARAVNCVAVLIFCALAAAPVAAQAQQPSPERRVTQPAATASPNPSPAVAPDATGNPDLSITANVTARELRFEVVPNPSVEFPGRPRRDTVWEAERTNLPPQVQPGVTYRDIGIRLRITSVFADIERIVAEALGEIPASDDAPPKINSNENATPRAANAPPHANETAQPDALPASTSDAPPATSDAPAPTSPAQTAPASTSPAQTAPASLSSQAGRARVRRSGGAGARRERP
jgi:hypothetical protein